MGTRRLSLLLAPILILSAAPLRAAATAAAEETATAAIGVALDKVQTAGQEIESFVQAAKAHLKEHAPDETFQICRATTSPENSGSASLIESVACRGIVWNSPDACSTLEETGQSPQTGPPPTGTIVGREYSPAVSCRERILTARLARAVLAGDLVAMNTACVAACDEKKYRPEDTAAFCKVLIERQDPDTACARLAVSTDNQWEDWSIPIRTRECVEKVKLLRGDLPCATVTKSFQREECATFERFRTASVRKNSALCGEDSVCRAMIAPDAEAALAQAQGLSLGPTERENLDLLRRSAAGGVGPISWSRMLSLIMRAQESNFRARASRAETLITDRRSPAQTRAMSRRLRELRLRVEAASNEFWSLPQLGPAPPVPQP